MTIEFVYVILVLKSYSQFSNFEKYLFRNITFWALSQFLSSFVLLPDSKILNSLYICLQILYFELHLIFYRYFEYYVAHSCRCLWNIYGYLLQHQDKCNQFIDEKQIFYYSLKFKYILPYKLIKINSNFNAFYVMKIV